MTEELTLQAEASGTPPEPSPVPETPAEGDTPPAELEPRRDRVSERFAKLTRALNEKDQAIVALQRQIDDIRQPQQPATSPVMPQGRPKPGDFTDYDEYVEKLTEWKAEDALQKREAKQREATARAEQHAAQKAWADKLQVAQAAHDDWEDVLEAADIRVSPALEEALVSSDQGPELLYYLAKNPGEATRLNALPPLQVARALGRLEAKLETATPSAKAQPPVTPRPPVPVSTSGTPPVGDPAQMSYQEYKAWRNRQGR